MYRKRFVYIHKCRVSYVMDDNTPRTRPSDSIHACDGDMHIRCVPLECLCDRQQSTQWLASVHEIGVYWRL